MLVEVGGFQVSLVLVSSCKNNVELEQVVENTILHMVCLGGLAFLVVEDREEKQQEMLGCDLNMKMEEEEVVVYLNAMIQINCSMEVVILELFVWSLDAADAFLLI